jgi:hypothetical protein
MVVRQMRVHNIDRGTPQESAQRAYVLQPCPRVETWVELEPLEQREAGPAREILDLTARGHAYGDLLPTFKQTLHQRQHRLCCPSPPAITQQV